MTHEERLERIAARLADAETMLRIARRHANHLRSVYPDESTIERLTDALRIASDCLNEVRLYAEPET